MPPQNEVSPALLLCRNTVCSSAGAGTRSGTFTNEVEECLQIQQRLPAGTRPLLCREQKNTRICKRRGCDVRVCNACFAMTHCDRYARAAAAKNAGITKSKKDLDKIHASRCSSNCDDGAGHAKKSPKCSFSPQSLTPSSVAAAPSESDYAPARAEGLHSSIHRAIAIAKCFARSTRHTNVLLHNSSEAVLAEGCRVRVKVM